MFRAAKRRKTAPKTERVQSEDESEEENISSLLKARSQPRPRTGGVQFSNAKSILRDEDEELSKVLALTSDENATQTLGGLQNRFVGSGDGSKVTNVDKHMYVYLPPYSENAVVVHKFPTWSYQKLLYFLEAQILTDKGRLYRSSHCRKTTPTVHHTHNPH